MHKREEKRRDLIAKASGDLSEEQEDELRKALVANKLQESVTNSELQATKDELEVFENAFRQIKEATGVSDINEVGGWGEEEEDEVLVLVLVEEEEEEEEVVVGGGN